VKPGQEYPQNAAPMLIDETSAQHRRFARAFDIIRDGIVEHVFPGAALAVTHRGRLLAWEGFGRFTYDPASPEVRRDTPWDLASLTKPIAMASMAMILLDRGKLQVHSPVVEYLPEFAETSSRQAPLDAAAVTEDEIQRRWRYAVTVAMLLAHSSGLPAHRRLYLEVKGREAMLDGARYLRLEAKPGTRAEYSDIGYIVLGELLESVAGEPLDSFCRREVFDPLKLKMSFTPEPPERQAKGSSARPSSAGWSGVPPTVDDHICRHRIVQGEVNDENASAMGGVAGHAGLFGDALSVAAFANCILNGGAPLFRPETVALFTARQAEPPGTSRALGWDTPSAPSQSGTMFSPSSFGHLGYTGTSLWCDAERQLSVTLLTNRTWPDSKNQAIKGLRPKVHDAIVEALEEMKCRG